MSKSPTRLQLRHELEAHLTELGYSSARKGNGGNPAPEIVRVNPVRGRIVYGETVLRRDLRRPSCHQRLLFFSQRRTRHRSSILFFIGVAKEDEAELTALLEHLDIRSSTRGGHVHVVAVAEPAASGRRATGRRGRA
jgi:hypothetical protein